MGKIKKTPSERHTATISPAITEFVQDATRTPLHELPAKLVAFPRLWPLPRGDLYHWIPLLDRFDHILELFNKEYALREGPQTQPFECRLLEKGDEEEGMPYPSAGAQKQELDANGFSEEGDRELVESIVYFTRILLEHCGNRSLYASSGHINDLLHTTSLSLLKAALKLGLRLAQRYQVARYKNNSTSMQPTLLANHYNFNLDNLHKLALPFPKPPSSLSNAAAITPGKGKDKVVPASSFNPSDLATLVKEPLSGTLKRELSNVNVTFYDQPAASAKPSVTHALPTEAVQTSPTPVRRTSALGPSRDRPSAGDRSHSSNDVSDTPVKSLEVDPSNAPKTYQLPAAEVAETPAWKLVLDALPHVPKESQFDLLNRIRIAHVFASPQPPIHLLMETRLLAIANLAYAVVENKFQEKIGQADGEEPRRFHLAQQLCDLLQPVANGESILTLDLETTVLQTLEALVRLKHKWSEVVEALAITVNHGILYYELRRAIATLHSEDHADTELELKETEWRTSVLTLVDTVSQANPQAKYAERMLAAGVMDIEIEVLTLRTGRAERHQEKVIGFLDAYIHNITSSFQNLSALKGLDILSDLAKYEVDTSLANLERGQGMPASYKSKVIDYDIPYYQQATLRVLFKFIVHLFDHASGIHDRELRNLLDSPQMLGALRTVIARASVFGSNVWSGAVNTVSNFIHNEPTSYQVVAEAGLAKGILETITKSTLPDEVPADFEPKVSYEPEPVEVVNGEVTLPTVGGILPVGETICDIPTAFGAICLNENGMKLFQLSNALDKFFDIFVSPAHVRALEDEGMAAATVGNAFDELSRHHPQLKDQILAAVIKMVKKVRAVTQTLAEQTAVGGKLWKLPSGTEEAEVAGGMRAVAGHGVVEASGRITADDINEDAYERAFATPYISTCMKFLEGFFHNVSMCQSFCVNGGAEVIIDLATSPSHPSDLVAYSVFGKMATVVKRMCEEKPHLVIPSLLARTQSALKNLKPLIESSEPGSYFRQFTDPKVAVVADAGAVAAGTTVVKSLLSAHILSHMLGRALVLSNPNPRHASVSQIFIQLNFTDVYVELVDAFSKLHSACLWENLALKEQFAETEQWRIGTDPKPFSPRRINAQGYVEVPERSSNSSNSSSGGSSNSEGKTDSDPKGFSESEIGETKAELFAFKNTRAIRYLVSQTPTGIESFFQNLGQILIPKRSSDLTTKQHAGLVADHLAKSALSELEIRKLGKVDEAAELKYVGHVLHCTTRMLLRTSHNHDTMGGKEAVTLVLLKFYMAGGFEKLQENLTRFSDILSRTEEKSEGVETAARESLFTILSFYSHVVRSKCINDSAQSSLLSVRGSEHADYFSSGQFLVELRKVVLDTVTTLWHSDAIVKMGDQNVKAIIEILKFILKAEGEERALARIEGATRRIATSQPEFVLKHFNNVDKVKSAGVEGDLAREALYRCNNSEVHATEYAVLRKAHGAPRFSIPGGDKEPESASSSSRLQTAEMRDAGAEEPTVSSSQEIASSDQDMSDDGDFGSLGALPQDMLSADMRAISGTPAMLDLMRQVAPSDGISAAPPAEDTKRPFITVEDLGEARDQVRADIIDRCLEVLSAQPSITFDLADLIQAAVAKSGEGANPKAEIGNTLVSSLLSLQGEEGPDSGLKIASYAHLVALIMQERDFFDSTLDELKDNFDSFINWIQLLPDQKAEDAPWIEMLLLIMERVLAEDEQPIEVEWNSPSIDEPNKPLPEPKAVDPVVPAETRTQLFSTIVDLLPKVGKNSSLALSITRVLVILTRRRDLASQLSEKMCMSRLFMMIRQLAGAVGEKLQSSFLLVLRHMVEDEQTIRQIMKTEIKNAFDNQRGARIDTTSYTRNMYHIVLRDPKMFVEVTQEMVEIPRFDGRPERAQTLGLKPVPPPEEKSAEASEDSAAVEASSETQAKPTEAKNPTTDSTDSIVAYLLRELSSYREVEDKPVLKKQESKAVSSGDSATTGDSDMADAATVDKAGEEKKEEKPVFKAEEHTIYIYKCFLLQCLSELLACYSRTKLEFINFSRKSDSQPATPSKPRSGTLMYLLNSLLPTGSLEHKDDIAHRKRQVTSNWATTVLVALCSQTQEKQRARTAIPDSEENADLLFVRRFVLDHAIKAYKDATTSPEPLDQRYSKLLAIADLFDRMLNAKADRQSPINAAGYEKSRQQLGRLMYEKNLIAALTSSVAELDLNFPNAKRAVKHILVPLKTLTDLAVDLSQRAELSSAPGTSTDEDDIASVTSASEEDSDDEREQTPDLYRNSALGIYNAEEDDDDDEEDDEDDEEMEDYEGYEEEMEFDEDDAAAPGDVVSDDDDDEDMEGLEDEMGPIEGLHGDRMEVEVIDESDDDEDDESGDDEEDEDEEGFSDHDLEEVTGDEENASMGDDMEEADWEDEADDYDDEEDAAHHGGPLDHIAQVLGEPLDGELDDRLEVAGADEGDEFFEDEMPPGDEEDDDEEDEIDFDGDVVYEPEHEDEEMDEMGWEWDVPPPAIGRGHHHHRHGGQGNLNEFLDFMNADPLRPAPSRYHRGPGNSRGEEEGTNPLLQRNSGGADRMGGATPPFLPRTARAAQANIIGDLVAAMNRPGGHDLERMGIDPRQLMNVRGGMPPVFAISSRGGAQFIDVDPRRPWRDQIPGFGTSSSRSGAATDEGQAVDFRPTITSARWQEEARMLFSGKHHDKATRVIHTVLRLLLPAAMEAKKLRDKEEAERRVAEEKARDEERKKVEAERKEREEREQKEREEKEAKEAEEAAARAREAAESAPEALESTQASTMEGVEQQATDAAGDAAATEQAPPRERVTITIRGRELDITELGIDREYIEALPEEFREDVIMGQFAERRAAERAEARQTGEAPSEISREFLDALPPEIQAELLASEARDRRQREQQEARRQSRAQGAPIAQPQDMDQVDFLATLDPGLRQTVLMEQDPDMLNLLPEELQREARELLGDRPRHRAPRDIRHRGPHVINVPAGGAPAAGEEEIEERTRSRPVVQMLDKPGVATLLRLMFVSLHHRAKTSLHCILSDVCKNNQNRAEVISILLSILQDGTADVGAVERSFAQLSLRAKQVAGSKTPQPLKRTLTGQVVTPATELSPLNIVQQCLGTLGALSSDNPKVQTFFLSEHETISNQKTKAAKKNKGKESKAPKYPLNALLMLLDRKLITENTGVMETLAGLLSRVTHPLHLSAKRKEADAKKEAEKKQAEEAKATSSKPADDVDMQEVSVGTTGGPSADAEATSTEEATEEVKEDSKPEPKKKRELEMPEVPEENIRLVINILALRECPSKTFSDTLDIIKHLCAIPGAKEIFGKELIRQAQELGQSIVADLEDLAGQIGTAKTGVDLQGMALAKFSSSGSQQRRLLQVLIALDHLFDPKRGMGQQNAVNGSVDPQLKEDILTTLSESTTFEQLWKNLSLCLAAIRQRGNMVNVATILLPLIETLFVVCRNSALKEPISGTVEVTSGTPPPETRMEGLFFSFTEEHRKILNELIRNNPKLMNGNLSILAKNSKVLEFDNKRNYFNRKLHTRADRSQPHGNSLQLAVRRDHVFLDSYKALYYKSGDEIKNGKLNIRFNGEEGIDAGGVSREWFAVMARQMFNPDYALFNPVASDRTTFHPNKLSGINDEHLSFFKFIGRVIGKALYEGRLLDAHFSRAVYRRMLGKSVSLKDMETLDLDYYRSLVWILENDITDVTFETFSAEVEAFGVTETVDLVPGGRDIAVTEENKQEYVRLVVEHRLIKSVEAQLDAFLGGFHDIVPSELVSIFNEQELELLISGLPDIDVDDWKNTTEYHNYQSTSPQIQWFWRAVKSFDEEERAKLLQFVTGTSKVPLNGFKELEGMNGFAKFNIHRDYSSKDKLPTSHTCFNQLDLPEYESYEHLRQQLYTAVTAGNEYFGFA
jgi:E3 ubiquitin-protein ligase HUWE1